MPCCPFYCPVAFQRNPQPFKRVIAFRVSSPKKEGVTPARSEKKNTRSMPTAPIPPQNYSTGSSAPFQINSKPN